jgi:hypothetical protein
MHPHDHEKVQDCMPIVQAAIVGAVSVLGDNLEISILVADVRTVGLRAIGRMQLRTGLLR